MVKFYAISLIFLFPLTLFPQRYTLDWGNIPESDLVMRTFPADLQAGAIVLGEVGQFFFNSEGTTYQYQLEVHRRIKLLDKNSFSQYARISIPFFYFNEMERILSVEAQTISPEGEVFPLKRRDFFYEKEDQHWMSVNFTFPQLEEGSVLEYRYTLLSKNIMQPRRWYFQGSIPVRFSQLSLHNSSVLSFATIFEGAEYMRLVEKDENEFQLADGDARFYFSDKFYLMENAPAIREEAFMTNVDDYRVRLRLQLSKITHPDGTPQPFLTTWEQFAEELLESPFFGDLFLLKKVNRKLNRMLWDKLELSADPENKMREIYNFLKQHVRWNGEKGFRPERDLSEAFQTGEASAAELNFMLLALLHAQRIEAHPVLTSTRDHGRMNQQYPLMEQFNYVLVLVNIGGRTWLLDPTDPLRPPGMPGIHTLNKKAWVVNPEWPQWINLNVPPCRDQYDFHLELQPSGLLSGRLEARSTSYSALQERGLARKDPTGYFWQERLQGFHQRTVVDSVCFRQENQLEMPFESAVTFSLPGTGDTLQDFVYLPLVFYANFSQNPFQQDQRNFPVDFPYPFEEAWRITLQFPAGYEVVELPDDLNFELPEAQGKLFLACKQDQDRVYCDGQFILHQDLIPPDDYPALKELFDHYVQLVKTRVVLRKR